jgi:hypothetical protein
MPERRGFRFALEVLFLAALAAALSFADLRPLAITGFMLLGWLLVALLEWVTWRGEAHYGRGLPPRYFVPRTSLPQPVPLEQPRQGYPEPERHDDAPTWVASPALRADLLGAWPVARATVDVDAEAPEEELAPEFDPVQLLAPRPEPPQEEESAAAIEPASGLQVATAVRLERHRIDPLHELERSRRPWRRNGDDEAEIATMPARPAGLRVLPLQSQQED